VSSGAVVGRQWNLEVSNQSFNIVDIKPSNMEDLTEVITCAEFHPTQCSTFALSSSKGSIRLVDMRQSALCDSHAKLFEEQASTAYPSLLSPSSQRKGRFEARFTDLAIEMAV
jgi:hypothetical protein